MRQIYFIPNIITAFALACGLFVIFKVNLVGADEDMFHLLTTSVVLLLVAAIADLLDGAVARAMHAESEFGFMFDSIADAVSFGVAPSVLFLKSLSLHPTEGLSFFAILSGMIYSVCGVLRLVRFNVKANEAKGDEAALAAQKKHFTGLPIPAGALASVSLTLFLFSPFALDLGITSSYVKGIIISCCMVILGYLMVSRLKFPSSKALHFRVPSFQLVFFTVIAAVIFLYGILHFFSLILLAISWGYVILGLILATIRLIAGKKSKTLEDFEPDEED